MRITPRKLLGLIVIGVGIYLAIDAARTPGGLGPIFREWTGLSHHEPPAPTQPAAPPSDVPTPSNPLHK